MTNKKKKIYLTYVTFGQDHVHYINNKTFDKDCVAVLENDSLVNGRKKVFEIFGDEFCFEYPEKHWDNNKIKQYYPRGLIYMKEGVS